MGVHQGRAWQPGPSHFPSQQQQGGPAWAATAPGIEDCPGAEAGPWGPRWTRLSRALSQAGLDCEGMETEVMEGGQGTPTLSTPLRRATPFVAGLVCPLGANLLCPAHRVR